MRRGKRRRGEGYSGLGAAGREHAGGSKGQAGAAPAVADAAVTGAEPWGQQQQRRRRRRGGGRSGVGGGLWLVGLACLGGCCSLLARGFVVPATGPPPRQPPPGSAAAAPGTAGAAIHRGGPFQNPYPFFVQSPLPRSSSSSFRYGRHASSPLHGTRLLSKHEADALRAEQLQLLHANGTALRDEDYQTLKGLVKAWEPLKARAFCLGLLRDAEARQEPYSVHSYLTLMKNLGRAGDWEGAMGVFEALRGRHEGVGGKEYMKLIRLLTRLGRYEEAMVYWEAMERSASAGGADFSLPPVLEYNKLFDILGRAKLWPRLRAAYDRMRADGVKPNKASYQVLAHSAAVAAPWSEVLRVLDDAMAEGLGTNYVFTMALKGLKVRRNWKAASTLIGLMRDRWGIKPDTVTYTAAISACERGANCSVALDLLDLMKADGAKPNHWTYSAAISACGRGRRLDEAVRLWDEMRASGLRPTQVVYNTMLSACERGKDLPRALGLLQEMISEGVARDVITWNTIISVCKECGDWSRACALLDEMRAVDGIAPDTISYNAAVAACAKAGAVEEARRLLVRMRTENVTRDTCTYNSLMDGYARAGSFPAVLQTLEQMARDEKGSQARPDVISYTQALSAAEKTGDFEAADRLLAQMKAAGVKWNQYTYAVVMAICEKTGRWPQALKLLQAMRRRGLTPDSTCYTVVMKACASAGKLGHCLALLQAMRDDGVTPTIHIYTILLTAAIQAGQLRTGIRLYHDMLAAAVRPNGVFVSAVLHALVEAGLNPSARAVLRRVARDPALRLDLAEFHVLLRAICRKGHLALAQDVLRHMEAAGVPPDVTAYNYIMLGYAAQGDAAATSALAAEMTRRGLEPNVFTFINLVRACAVAGCPERALAIVDPAFPWDFYSAAITIFHQYGCFPQADALYAAAVQHGRAPVDPDRQLAEEGLLDLHGLSSPVAAAAVRYALKRVRARWRREGPAAVQDMVLISGLGKGSLVPFSPTIRPLVQDLLVEQYYPPIDSTTVPGNAGRVVVSRESLLAWLEGDGDGDMEMGGQLMAGLRGSSAPARAPAGRGGGGGGATGKRPSSSSRKEQGGGGGGGGSGGSRQRGRNNGGTDLEGPPLPAGGY